MKHPVFSLSALMLSAFLMFSAPARGQELQTTEWKAYGISFLAPADIATEDDSEEGYIVYNADYYITVQLLAGEGFSISEIPQELKNIATDDEVAAQTEVEIFELPQFHGAKLEGNCDEDRCVYSYLIAKDGSCGFYVSVIYKSQEEPVAEKILSSFRMEDN